MPNMRPDKNPMPHQDPQARAANFDEVALGYTQEQAVDEAQRCLNCKNSPCVSGCPVQIRIPEFIAKVAEGDFEGAYQIIVQDSALPAVCGRVCPQESQCEAKCVRGIKGEPVAIGRLERFVADWHNANAAGKPVKPAPNGHKVAVIGSGPAGLTCAGDLAKKGYDVTVFEALHLAGGVLVYGIPEFRLPKSIVQKEVDTLKELGVKIETNMVIGRCLTIDELKEELGFEAVFIGSGAGLPKFMNIPGENLKGVYSANEFLTRINLMKAYKDGADTPIQHSTKVAVVGGGNVAMDAARCARRLGAQVYIVYRRSEKELPARAEETLTAVMRETPFLLQEQQRFWRRKWRRDHRGLLVMLAVAAVAVQVTGAVVSETRRERQKAMTKCVKIWAVALVAALVIGFAACTGCVNGGDPARRAAVKAEIAEVMRLAYDVGGREIVSNRIERLVTDGKVTDEQAAYLHAAAQAVYERTVERLAPTNAPAAKAD